MREDRESTGGWAHSFIQLFQPWRIRVDLGTCPSSVQPHSEKIKKIKNHLYFCAKTMSSVCRWNEFNTTPTKTSPKGSERAAKLPSFTLVCLKRARLFSLYNILLASTTELPLLCIRMMEQCCVCHRAAENETCRLKHSGARMMLNCTCCRFVK